MRKCSKCETTKDESSFYRKGRGLQSWCKDCTNENARNHYKENKREKIEYTKRQKRKQVEKNRQFVVDYLFGHPCIDCGENDIVVLEFDHREDKSYNIASMFRRSTERLKEEINKCDVRCANCHRRKTATEAQHYRTYLFPSLAQAG